MPINRRTLRQTYFVVRTGKDCFFLGWFAWPQRLVHRSFIQMGTLCVVEHLAASYYSQKFVQINRDLWTETLVRTSCAAPDDNDVVRSHNTHNSSPFITPWFLLSSDTQISAQCFFSCVCVPTSIWIAQLPSSSSSSVAVGCSLQTPTVVMNCGCIKHPWKWRTSS